MKIRPINEKIVVRRLETDPLTKGGIALPDSAKEVRKEAEVVAVGPGKVLDNGTRSPMTVQVGQIVLLSSYSGTEVKVDGESFLIMEESDVLGILETS